MDRLSPQRCAVESVWIFPGIRGTRKVSPYDNDAGFKYSFESESVPKGSIAISVSNAASFEEHFRSKNTPVPLEVESTFNTSRVMSESVHFGERLYDAVDAYGDRELLTDTVRDTRHCGSECIDRIDECAHRLDSSFRRQPQWVSLVGHNDVRYLSWYIALQRRGICTAELLPDWPTPLLERAVDYIAAPAAIVESRLLDEHDGALEGYKRVAEHDSWTLLNRREALPDVDLSDRAAAMAFTGGTSGTIKAALLSQRGYLHVVNEVDRYLENTKDDVISTALPWQHGYGKSVVLSAVACGARFVRLERTLFARPTWETMRSENVTTYSGVPTQYRQWLRESADDCVSNLRIACVAGGALRREELRSLDDRLGQHSSVVPMYGLTEMTTRVSYLRQKYFRNKLGSCGRPLRDIDVKVEGTGTDGGELLVRGPNEMLEYWRKPEATENVFTEDGWLRTGDWAEIDEEGFIWLKGRRKDVVKRGGAAIYPEILENFVQTLQGVTDVAAVGVTRIQRRDRLGLFVKSPVDSSDVPPSTQSFDSEIRRELGSPYRPDRTTVLDELPRTHAGKVDRSELRGLLDQQLDASEGTPDE